MGPLYPPTCLQLACFAGSGARSSPVSGKEQLLHINVQRFRGGLVFKAHRLLCHSTLGLRVPSRVPPARLFRGVRRQVSLVG